MGKLTEHMHLLATGQSRKYDAEQQGALAADVSHARAETEALIRRVGGGLLYRRPGDSSATLEGTGKMKEAVGWHVLITGPIKEPDEALAFVNECVGFRTS